MQKTAKVTIEFTRNQIQHSLRRHKIKLDDESWDIITNNDIVISLPYAENNSDKFGSPIDGASLMEAAFNKYFDDKDQDDLGFAIKLLKVDRSGNAIDIDLDLNGKETIDEALEKVKKAIEAEQN